MDNAYALTPADEITPDYALTFLTEVGHQRARSLALPTERREATAAQVQACRAVLDAELAELRAIRDRAQGRTENHGHGHTTARYILTGQW